MKKFIKLAKGSYPLLIATAALMATSCAEDYSDDINKLSDRITITEGAIESLQNQINDGGLVTKVEPTSDGFKIYFSGDITSPITITNGAAGANGKSAYELAVENGYTGTESEWLTSLVGGTGADGKSAYDLAVENGYTGTESEWLASLVGGTGADGKSAYDLAVENGFVGTKTEWLASLVGGTGADGNSAYETAVENGFVGTEEEWLASLVGGTGADGDSAYETAVENGFVGTKEEWLASLVGENGKDLTVGSITYRNCNDYGLLFIDALDADSDPRIIYLPMDVATPTSITVMTGKLDVTLGKETKFDVIVNPTENAKKIDEFNLVVESGYTRGSSYGEAPEGFAITNTEDKGNGRYTLTVDCSSTANLDDAIFVAATYSVNTFDALADIAYSNGLKDGSVPADFYQQVKDNSNGLNSYKQFELISSTPLLGADIAFTKLEDADLNEIPTIDIYEMEFAEVDLLVDAANAINVNNISATVLSGANGNGGDVTAENDLNFTYDKETNKLKITSLKDQLAIKKVFLVELTVEDFNADVDAKTKQFKVNVYNNADIVADLSANPIKSFLPAVVGQYAVNTDTEKDLTVDFSSELSSIYEYDFSDYTYTVKFVDDYKLEERLGVDITNYDPTSLVSLTFNNPDDVVYNLKGEEGDVILQPGTYEIIVEGKAKQPSAATSDMTVQLVHKVKVYSPEYRINAISENFVSSALDTYMVTDYKAFDVVSNIIAAGETTVQVVNDAPYAYVFAADGEVVTSDKVRALVNGIEATTVPAGDATISFYYKLETGVIFPVDAVVENTAYEALNVKFAPITLEGTWFNCNSRQPIPYYVNGVQNVATYESGAGFRAMQALNSIDPMAVDSEIRSNTIPQPMIGDVTYASTVTYTYTVDPTVYYSTDGTNWNKVAYSGDPVYDGLIDVTADGKVSIKVNNLNWTALPTGAQYKQSVTVTATDFFGTVVECNPRDVVIIEE